MSQLGEVNLKVKQAILITQKFTIAQIADITGLNYRSVETVIQRLFKKGILVKVKENSQQTIIRRGRPKQYYAIGNKKAEQILKSEIDAFTIEKALGKPNREEPRNPHFIHAKSLVEAVETRRKEFIESLSEEIKLNLNLARKYEEMVNVNPEIGMAYIDFLQARFEYLRGEDEETERFLKRAKSVFKHYHMNEEEQKIEKYYLTLKLEAVIQAAKKLITQQKYHLLKDKLIEIASSFPDDFISDKIGVQLKEILDFTAKLCAFASELKIRNEELEQRNEWLRKENFALQLEQQLMSEINHELFQARGEFIREIDTPYWFFQELLFQRPQFSAVESLEVISLSSKTESSLERKRILH